MLSISPSFEVELFYIDHLKDKRVLELESQKLSGVLETAKPPVKIPIQDGIAGLGCNLLTEDLK